MLGSQGMRASPARGAAGLSSGEEWKRSVRAFLLSKGNFQLFYFILFFIEGGLALTDWRWLFLQVEDGQVFPKHHLLFMPLPGCGAACEDAVCTSSAQLTPVETLQPTSIGDRSNWWWRDAWDTIQQKVPGHSCKWTFQGLCTLCTSVLEVGVPVQQPAVSSLGVYVRKTPLIALLTAINSLTFGRALQIRTGLEVMSGWLPRLSGQL